MMIFTRSTRAIPILIIVCWILAWPATGLAASGQLATRTACVYDPSGANGFVSSLFKRYAEAAQQWGYRFKSRLYIDEEVAAGDFKAGHCDLVMLTGVRARQFVPFAGSLDMAGGLETYAQERKAIQIMSSAKAADLMHKDNDEVVGVVPLGKVFLFARQRQRLLSLDRMAGQKLAVLRYDRQAKVLANTIGAQPVPAGVTALGPLFNNGSVDMTYAPAIAFRALELREGLTADGGIGRFVLGMLSGQMLIHRDRFNDDYGQQSRQWVVEHLFDRGQKLATDAENDIPKRDWVPINDDRATRYRQIFRQVREQLWKEDWYSHRMQRLLKKIRCSDNPSFAECSLASEGGPVL